MPYSCALRTKLDASSKVRQSKITEKENYVLLLSVYLGNDRYMCLRICLIGLINEEGLCNEPRYAINAILMPIPQYAFFWILNSYINSTGVNI